MNWVKKHADNLNPTPGEIELSKIVKGLMPQEQGHRIKSSGQSFPKAAGTLISSRRSTPQRGRSLWGKPSGGAKAAGMALAKEAVLRKLPKSLRKPLTALTLISALAPSPAKAGPTVRTKILKRVKPYKAPGLNEILEGKLKKVDQPVGEQQRRLKMSVGVSRDGIAGLHARF